MLALKKEYGQTWKAETLFASIRQSGIAGHMWINLKQTVSGFGSRVGRAFQLVPQHDYAPLNLRSVVLSNNGVHLGLTTYLSDHHSTNYYIGLTTYLSDHHSTDHYIGLTTYLCNDDVDFALTT